jgi:uncharacterized membrane protein
MVELGSGVTRRFAQRLLVRTHGLKSGGEAPLFIGRAKDCHAFILTNQRLIWIGKQKPPEVRTVGPLAELHIRKFRRTEVQGRNARLDISRASQPPVVLDRLFPADAASVLHLIHKHAQVGGVAPDNRTPGRAPSETAPASLSTGVSGVRAPRSANRVRQQPKVARGKFASAALVAVAAASTIALLLAMLAFGIADLWTGRLSTGGLTALIAAFYFGVRCDSWEDFSRRIWIWVAIAAVQAFLVVGYTASTITTASSMGANLGFRT